SWMVPDETLAWLAGRGLAGVEVSHPEQDFSERSRLSSLVSELGLVASGGSDDHGTLTGHRIGCETISPESYERLAGQANGAVPVQA
ncbi:MAG TPA: phosphatase, partial [Streptosporangiaceae bacterium]